MKKSEVRQDVIKELYKVADKTALHKQLQSAMTFNNERLEAQKLYHKLFNTKAWKDAQIIATTISNPLELNTIPIIQKAFVQNKITVVPKDFGHRNMQFYIYNLHDKLAMGIHGIWEPIDSPSIPAKYINLMIVPCLKIDARGNRIGFGKGYYDKFLHKYPNINTVSLARRVSYTKRANWKVSPNDVQIKHVITV